MQNVLNEIVYNVGGYKHSRLQNKFQVNKQSRICVAELCWQSVPSTRTYIHQSRTEFCNNVKLNNTHTHPQIIFLKADTLVLLSMFANYAVGQ